MEYKAISFYGQLNSEWTEELQGFFDAGWEYVDSIAQSVSMRGTSRDKMYGDVIVILKRNKISL
jgi:hypothetical protein